MRHNIYIEPQNEVIYNAIKNKSAWINAMLQAVSTVELDTKPKA